MRSAQLAILAIAAAAGPAAADRFGGFSGIDRPYLVNQDRVCAPLPVSGGAATGAPRCQPAAADAVARLAFKDPAPERGPKATFAAAASGRALTVTRKASGAEVVAWTALDPIVRVVDVYASPYQDRVAVAYATRRLGKEVIAIVAFDLGQGAAITPTPEPAPTPTPTPGPAPAPGPAAAPAPADPKLEAAAAKARKASGARAAAAWQAVLALDAQHAEALYRTAAAHAAARRPAAALAALAALAASPRPDAIEWRVEARFDAAFAALRTEPKFRAAVGLDRKAATSYERLMGFGGTWEQTGTACDAAEVRLDARRDRTFKLKVRTFCQGNRFEMPFKGTWRLEGDRVVLTLPNKGRATTADDEAGCAFEAAGDEDALRCQIGRDLEFTVLPTRR